MTTTSTHITDEGKVLIYIEFMNTKKCSTCQKANPTLVCGVCSDDLCKNCALFLEKDRFSFLPQIPSDLKHAVYCGPCFDAKVNPEIEIYDQTIEKAKNLTVFFTTDSKRTRTFSRKEKPLKVQNCADREETLLRLAFLAAQNNFNAMIDVEITSQKIRTGSYQTTSYSGTGIPTNLTSERMR